MDFQWILSTSEGFWSDFCLTPRLDSPNLWSNFLRGALRYPRMVSFVATGLRFVMAKKYLKIVFFYMIFWIFWHLDFAISVRVDLRYDLKWSPDIKKSKKTYENIQFLFSNMFFAITKRKHVATKETILGYLNAPLTLRLRKYQQKSGRPRHFSVQNRSKMDRIHRKSMIIDDIRDDTAPSSLGVC